VEIVKNRTIFDVPPKANSYILTILNIFTREVDMGNMHYCSNTDISCSKMNK